MLFKMVSILLILIFFSATTLAQGLERLSCFECVNSRSNEDCLKNGQIKLCQPNERACMTEIRRERSEKKQVFITKRCKDAHACENNYWQNVGGVKDTPQARGRQCAGELGLPFTSTTCRCCCGYSLCNAGLYSTCLNAQDNALRDEVLVVTPTLPVCTSFEFYGEKKCSHGYREASHCRFQCHSGYQLYGPNEISCQKTDGYNVKWTAEPPCCAKRCPPYALADVLLILQSNVRNSLDWVRIKNFIATLMSPFMQPRDSDTNIGIFTFSDKPDRRNEISFRNGYENQEFLMQTIRSISKTSYPGVNLDRAIRHAQRTSLAVSEDNRYEFRDVIILVTYGNSFSNHSPATIPARQLRDQGTTILILNIQPRGSRLHRSYLNKLQQIAGSRDKVFVIENGIRETNSALSQQIQSALCGDPCKR